MLGEVFGLRISEGAISNMLQRASKPLLAAQSAIQTAVTAAPVVCCDETSARVCGRNWWEWVFVTSRVCRNLGDSLTDRSCCFKKSRLAYAPA